ncbi:MAG: glycerate kinase [Bacteroidaceae bacterium]|nr:glycerate kinase [Bacteroidaceae bacterium]
MKIVAAFDSFKGCLTARQACGAALEAVLSQHPQARTLALPLSDGGEGLVDCLRALPGMHSRRCRVRGPLGDGVEAEYLSDGETAVIEVAAACGLTLVEESRRDVVRADTYGVGQLIADALKGGCRRLVIGLGDTATCDGGCAMVEALRDGGVDMKALGAEVVLASDVNNPLCGPEGAARVFAPQKGATVRQVEMLEERLCSFARKTEAEEWASPELARHPGAGAAGGLGYALMAYMGARMQSGIETVLSQLRFDEAVKGADLVLTGEGRSDRQTLMGKAPVGVLHHGIKVGVPVALLSGAVDDEAALKAAGFAFVESINAGDPRPLEELMRPETATAQLQEAVRRVLLKI